MNEKTNQTHKRPEEKREVQAKDNIAELYFVERDEASFSFSQR